MLRVSEQALREVEAAFDTYEQTIAESPLRPHAQQTYLLHSRNFVRWLKGDFAPGAKVASRRRRGP